MHATTVVMVSVSGLLIAAHFFRSSDYLLAVAGVLLPALLIVRKPSAAKLLQLLLVLAALEWLRTLWVITTERTALGQPWMRMALILSAVSALALAAAFLVGRQRRASGTTSESDGGR